MALLYLYKAEVVWEDGESVQNAGESNGNCSTVDKW